MSRRVVVTGVGLVCGCGIGTAEVWRNLLAGKSGIARITQFDAAAFDCQIAGEVKGFDPLNWIEKKEVKKMARFIHLAMAASEFAIRMAELEITPDFADAAGVYIGSGIGGFDVIEREHSKYLNGGPGKISPFFIPSAIVNLAAGNVSIRWGAKGPNSATATACSAGAHAVGDAYKIIQRCDAEVMIAGGSEAAVTPMSIGGFGAMRALSTRNGEPERASRPFDADRDGFIVGAAHARAGLVTAVVARQIGEGIAPVQAGQDLHGLLARGRDDVGAGARGRHVELVGVAPVVALHLGRGCLTDGGAQALARGPQQGVAFHQAQRLGQLGARPCPRSMPSCSSTRRSTMAQA